MKKEILPFAQHGISGGIAVKLPPHMTLDDFCMQHIPVYDPDRFEAIALRLFAGKEVVLTIYALDKSRQEGTNYHPDKLPVKKFKIQNASPQEIFSFFEEYHFTIATGNYDLTDMEVINK